MKHTEIDIDLLYKTALFEATTCLSDVSVARGRCPKLKGLNGWIYEQTIRSCIEDELLDEIEGIGIEEQVKLHGRTRIDLVVGSLAIEIKSGGFFGKSDAEKYCKYRKILESLGKRYLYITAYETHEPYRKLAIDTFGDQYTFFLDSEGSWGEFIKTIRQELKLTE